MRGARAQSHRDRLQGGIIPADAGSTDEPVPGPDPEEDHPRGCGEHMIGLVPWHVAQGSSPRMRGAQHDYALDSDPLRIIPADAGSTRCL